MKKLFFLGVMAAMLSSCSVLNRATVMSASNPAPMKTTTTVASLKVSDARISYTYTPRKADAKRLTQSQLLDNAIFMALQENGNGDVMVKVNYHVSVKRTMFGKRVTSITLSGYPAKYVDFRQPTDEDYKNLETFPQETLDVLGKSKAGESVMNKMFGKKRRNK